MPCTASANCSEFARAINQSRSYDCQCKSLPRIGNTKPRKTSAELSFSGEKSSTAGEERPRSAWVGASVAVPLSQMSMPTTMARGLMRMKTNPIENEYHPSFVRIISKRHRKGEVGWENLVQPVCYVSGRTIPRML